MVDWIRLPQDQYCGICHKRIGNHDGTSWWQCLALLSQLQKKLEMLSEDYN